MQQAATTDPTGLAQIPQAPPLGLALGILFVLALTLFVFVLKRKNEHASPQARPVEPQPQARQQGEPFVIDREESTPAPACCTVAEAVRDYFDDPPRSFLLVLSTIISESPAFAQLRDDIEADVDQKLEKRFTEHRAETARMLQAHREESSKMLMVHVSQVTAAVATANDAQTKKVLDAIQALGGQ